MNDQMIAGIGMGIAIVLCLILHFLKKMIKISIRNLKTTQKLSADLTHISQ